ncbi:MAG: S8 family serine peptidase, partial [Candidatus Eisenbacteria bacterium]|nr:S8 family serine peptidase [Candidatus Eisenbacteria bacterium]
MIRRAAAVLTVLCLLSPSLHADDAKLTPLLRAALDRMADAGGRDLSASFYGHAVSPGPRLACFVRLRDASVDPARLDFRPSIHAGDLATARLTPAAIRRLVARPEVTAVALAVPLDPLLDVSMAETNCAAVHQSDGSIPPAYSGFSGRGVIAGIVDIGIDPDHADFRTPDGSRIVSLWDQTDGTGTPPAEYDYGSEWTQSQIDAGECPTTDPHGHGTHVASIAAGNGAATGNDQPSYRYVGAAPEADLIVVKSTLQDVHVVEAVDYIFARAMRQNRPAVVNISLGNQYGPHDGTAFLDDFINRLTGPGRLVVAAAGNERGDSVHAEVVLDPHSFASITWDLPPYSPGGSTEDDYLYIDGWSPGEAGIAVTVTSPGGATVGPVAMGEVEEFET